MRKLQLEYGADPYGFYWPESPAKRKEYLTVKKSHPGVAEAIYQCNPGALEGDIFKEEDFRYYEPPRRLMDGIRENLDFVSSSDMIIQSWDTAFSANKDANWTVCTTAMLVQCKDSHGSDEELLKLLGIAEDEVHYDVYILDVFREKIAFGDLVQSAVIQYNKWRPSYVLIEKKATGAPLINVLEQKSIPILACEPGMQSKRARAVHGVKAGSTQGWVQQHRVWFPREALWLDDWTKELKNFSGADDGIDDQVDSFVQLVNFAITQGADAARLPTDQSQSTYGTPVADGPVPPMEILQSLNPEEAEKPRVCQFCIHYNKGMGWCGFFQQPTTALDSCDNYDDGVENPF